MSRNITQTPRPVHSIMSGGWPRQYYRVQITPLSVTSSSGLQLCQVMSNNHIECSVSRRSIMMRQPPVGEMPSVVLSRETGSRRSVRSGVIINALHNKQNSVTLTKTPGAGSALSLIGYFHITKNIYIRLKKVVCFL